MKRILPILFAIILLPLAAFAQDPYHQNHGGTSTNFTGKGTITVDSLNVGTTHPALISLDGSYNLVFHDYVGGADYTLSALAGASGSLPSMTGESGYLLTNNGSAAQWTNSLTGLTLGGFTAGKVAVAVSNNTMCTANQTPLACCTGNGTGTCTGLTDSTNLQDIAYLTSSSTLDATKLSGKLPALDGGSLTGVAAATVASGGTGTNVSLLQGSSLSAGAGSGSRIPGSSLTAGNIYYMASGGLTAAKADSASTLGAICLADSTTSCMYNGVYKFSSNQSWTVGATLYVSDASAGAMVTTAPSTSGHFLQKFGEAIASDTILIMPSLDIGTLP